MDRRTFLKAALTAAVPAPLAAASYGMYEAGSVRIERPTVSVPRLPRTFDGLRVAFLTDLLHGPYVGVDSLTGIVRTTLALTPDLILLGGNYSCHAARYAAPCFDVLAGLRAPLGVFGVLGNHDYLHSLAETRAGFRTAGIGELTNSGVWIERGSSRFRLAGVDDLWYGHPDAAAALGDTNSDAAALLVSHNPDFAERLRDPRVGLVLSGHTRGGQISLPGYGAPIRPSRYGQKYMKGLVQAPTTQVYISRGLGTATPPLRYNSPPELTLLNLRAA